MRQEYERARFRGDAHTTHLMVNSPFASSCDRRAFQRSSLFATIPFSRCGFALRVKEGVTIHVRLQEGIGNVVMVASGHSQLEPGMLCYIGNLCSLLGIRMQYAEEEVYICRRVSRRVICE